MGILNIDALKPGSGGQDDWDLLHDLLDYCDVPHERVFDLGWLNRNLLINNQNPEAHQAHAIVGRILKKESQST